MANGTYRHKDNRGNLFENTSKQEREDANPNWPDFTGDGAIICSSCGDRIEVDMACWDSESNSGKWYLAMQFSDKQENRKRAESSKMGRRRSNPTREEEPPEEEEPPPPMDDGEPF